LRHVAQLLGWKRGFQTASLTPAHREQARPAAGLCYVLYVTLVTLVSGKNGQRTVAEFIEASRSTSTRVQAFPFEQFLNRPKTKDLRRNRKTVVVVAAHGTQIAC
jgi:hypothetical protein